MLVCERLATYWLIEAAASMRRDHSIAPITVNVTEPKATTAEIAARLKEVLREVKDEEARASRARLYD
jgi:hypothetical protein